MGLEVIFAAAAIVVSGLIYFAGIQRGQRQERERQRHENELEQIRQAQARQLENERREREMASKVADEYVDMVRRSYDSGPHALARLGLERLGSDQLIRQAIHEMQVRTNTDPWANQAHHLDDVDLVAFFRKVSERKINFFQTTVEGVANEVREK